MFKPLPTPFECLRVTPILSQVRLITNKKARINIDTGFYILSANLITQQLLLLLQRQQLSF